MGHSVVPSTGLIRYSDLSKGASWLHRLDFWSKTLAIFVFMPFSVFLAPRWMVGLLVVLTLLLVLTSRVGLARLWQLARTLLIQVFVGIVIVSLILAPGTWLQRLTTGLEFAVRFSIVIVSGHLFNFITSPLEIPIGVLRLGLPHKFGITAMIAFRMFPLVSTKMTDVLVAQQARGVRFGLSPRNAPNYVALLIPLILGTLQMALDFDDGLAARGYDENRPITLPPSHVTLIDFAVVAVTAGILVLAVAL